MNQFNPVEPKDKIVIVDDNLDNLTLLQSMLEQQGYQVRKAINGEMALKGIEAAQPDLILLDINMPQMDGYQVCQHLKANPNTCDIPVIFLTALSETENKVKGFEVGGVDYITKPFHIEEVIVRVKNQLRIKHLQTQLNQNISSLSQANAELEKMATIDGLTEIANRRRFDQYLQEEWRRSQRYQNPLSLILIDVDCFKLYNDFYGHQAGDVCLQQVAQQLKNSVKRASDLIARYGGEEFAVILPNTNAIGAARVAEKIQTQVAQLQIPHATSSSNPFVTVSLGVATTIPQIHTHHQRLIEAADAALYQAKHQGRNCYIISPIAI